MCGPVIMQSVQELRQISGKIPVSDKEFATKLTNSKAITNKFQFWQVPSRLLKNAKLHTVVAVQ